MLATKVEAVQLLQKELGLKEAELLKREESLREKREASHKLELELNALKVRCLHAVLCCAC